MTDNTLTVWDLYKVNELYLLFLKFSAFGNVITDNGQYTYTWMVIMDAT